MKNQFYNFLSVKTFVQLMITDIIDENKGFTIVFSGSLEFLENNVQEVKKIEVVKNRFFLRVRMYFLSKLAKHPPWAGFPSPSG